MSSSLTCFLTACTYIDCITRWNVHRKLSLSTNMIERIAGISSLKRLRILSLSRNSIKTFSGLEAIGDHLEELWISYNLIEKIKGVSALKALKVLYMGNNLVKDWAEFNRLQEIPNLQDLLFINNPICDKVDVETWRAQVIKRLPGLKKLDAITIVYVFSYFLHNAHKWSCKRLAYVRMYHKVFFPLLEARSKKMKPNVKEIRSTLFR